MNEHDYTRQNIRFLLKQRGLKISNVARESGAGQSWVSRFMSGEFERNVGKIELIARYLGVPAQRLMYENLASDAELSQMSQSMREEAAIVEAAVKLERELAGVSPSPLPPETYAQRLYIAMKVVQEDGAAGVLDGSSLVGALRRLATELRKTG